MTKPTFEPMEWAVLVTSIGGRPFQVETTTWTAGGVERVHEYYIQRGDTQSRYALHGGIGSHVSHLIKVTDKATAEAAAELLVEVFEKGNRLYLEAMRNRDRAVSRAADTIRDMLR